MNLFEYCINIIDVDDNKCVFQDEESLVEERDLQLPPLLRLLFF